MLCCVNARHLFVGLECKGRVANWDVKQGKKAEEDVYFEPIFRNSWATVSPENWPL